MPVSPNAALAGLISACSPYLRLLMEREAGFAARAFAEPADHLFTELLAEAGAAARFAAQPEHMRALRIAKARAHLLIAVADVGGAWDVDRVTEALTQFADACLRAAVGWLLADAARAGKALSAAA